MFLLFVHGEFICHLTLVFFAMNSLAKFLSKRHSVLCNYYWFCLHKGAQMGEIKNL